LFVNLEYFEITSFDEHPVILRNNLVPNENDLKKALLYWGQAKKTFILMTLSTSFYSCIAPNFYIDLVDKLAGKDDNIYQEGKK